MFKPSMQYFIKTHLFDIASFELLSYRKSFCLVKHSDFEYINDSLHDTRPPFHVKYTTTNPLSYFWMQPQKHNVHEHMHEIT